MSGTGEHADYYAARAAEYDASVGYGSPRVEVHLEPLKTRLRGMVAGRDTLEIACGTGYWTEVASASARSIVATDLDPTSVALARARVASRDSIRCQLADAYSLEGVTGHFDAAFSMFWWSHIPKSRLPSFLRTLHGKLQSGATVTFVDQLPYAWSGKRRFDDEGNLIEERMVSGGARFEIIKNFPTESDLVDALAGSAQRLVYAVCPDKRWWMITYQT